MFRAYVNLEGLNHAVRAALTHPRWENSSARTSGMPLGVAVATPIYAPFLKAPSNHPSARLIQVPLARCLDGQGIWRYEIDEVALEAALSRPDVRLLMWCNPHNPTGRVWTYDEMLLVARLCNKNGMGRR